MQQIKVLDKTYTVQDHWFWKEYNKAGWEQQTLKIYKQYLNKNTVYIDIGTWLGVTIFYANEIGCKDIYGVEANPLSYELTMNNCELNNINVHLENIAITDKSGMVHFGSTNTNDTSSASSLRGDKFLVQGKTFTEYLKDKPKDNLFVKIDIEGAEELIVSELNQINGYIWLSIHVPFISDKERFYKELSQYNVVCDNLRERIFSNDTHPAWGTVYGNFFEVLIINN